MKTVKSNVRRSLCQRKGPKKLAWGRAPREPAVREVEAATQAKPGIRKVSKRAKSGCRALIWRAMQKSATNP